MCCDSLHVYDCRNIVSAACSAAHALQGALNDKVILQHVSGYWNAGNEVSNKDRDNKCRGVCAHTSIHGTVTLTTCRYMVLCIIVRVWVHVIGRGAKS